MAITFNQLQVELISEILSKLSARSLLRLRCVSKSLRDLIDTPNLIKSHLSQNGCTKIYFFFGTEIGLLPSDPTGITLNFERFNIINNSRKSLKIHLSFPFVLCSRVVGSCDGLFCFISVETDAIALINPCTREGYHIPHPINRRVGLCEVGFGYDPSSDEYKVIRIQRIGKDPNVEINIYYLKSKKWKQMLFSCDYNDYLASLYSYYSHGALHWSLHKTGKQSSSSRKSLHISIFDLVKEKFIVDKYDKEMFGNPNSFDLGLLGGCLSLQCWGMKRDSMELWVMKEYGVKESWCKLYSFVAIDVLPLALSRCGRRILVKERGYCDLFWCDVDTKRFIDTNTSVRNTSCSHGCFESLIRLS